MTELVTLALCGDVMLGRGIDQVLPHPGDPRLWERHVGDAWHYVDLAEATSGPIPRPVGPAWPWGVTLDVLEEAAPDVRIINLETSVTRSDDAVQGKAVHYRMHPENLAALTVARPDVCVLANNHVADLGTAGLEETIDTLAAAGLTTAGAGRDADEAWRPAVIELDGGHRVLVVAVAMPSSGVPDDWAATASRPGVAFVEQPTRAAAAQLLERVAAHRRDGDVVVASIHWGSNWGHQVPPSHRTFAHALVDGGVDVVHGHSSHHPRPVEVHARRLVLYGCGDLINDYEGIRGHEAYRSHLRLLYLVSLDATTGALVDTRLVPLEARRLRLEHASAADTRWLATTLDHASRPLDTGVEHWADGHLRIVPTGVAPGHPAS